MPVDTHRPIFSVQPDVISVGVNSLDRGGRSCVLSRACRVCPTIYALNHSKSLRSRKSFAAQNLVVALVGFTCICISLLSLRGNDFNEYNLQQGLELKP